MCKSNKLPYTNISEDLNNRVAEIMDGWNNLVSKAKSLGLDIKFAADSRCTLELYFNDDYPGTILVDKEISSKRILSNDSTN